MIKNILGILLLVVALAGLGKAAIIGIEKDAANRELYGWRADADGVQYRNIDIRNSGG